MTQGLGTKWIEALSLSRRHAPEFYQTSDEIEPGPHAESVRFALEELGLAAVFCIEGVPTIGFLKGADLTTEQVDTVHRVLWNQGLMSLLLVIRDDELIAYSLVQRPLQNQRISGVDPRLIETLSLVANSLELRDLVESAESGRFWYEHDDYFDPANRVDNVLLSNLLHAFRELKADLGGDAAQALLMQSMFIAYLEDRKIIKADVFQNASRGAHSSFAEILEAKTPAPFERLFVWLKKAFNGNVFNAPCAFDLGEVAPPKINTSHLQVLGRFRHGREEMASSQLRFWGYDFQYMPIALISAVYDRFLKEEAAKKSHDGAFYTPMFLADVVVDQIWDELTDQQRATGIFCDPACGSGIFLVRLFQRLVSNHCRLRNKRHATWKELTNIARRLHGADINSSAVRVAAFSLYIALLEQSNPRELPVLIEGGKLLPSLYRETLRPAEDFFETGDAPRYDAIIGNPPWKGRAGQTTSAQKWVNARGRPYPAKDIAWGFIWKSLVVLKPGGVIGLLLPAMGVLHNTSDESQQARRELLQAVRIRRVINFSDLCFQLFDGAKRPTALIVYRHCQEGEAAYRFEYWVPKADLNLRLKRLLTLSRSDRTRLRTDDVEGDPSLFKRRLWTRSPDEKLLQYLRQISPLSGLVQQFKDVRDTFDRKSHWVIGQGFKPAQADRIAESDYQTTSAPVVTLYPYLSAGEFESIVLPNIETNPWPDSLVHRAGFSEGFRGPHIIIPQGVERSVGRVRAAYTEQDLVFEHSLQAIIFPTAERGLAKLLTAVLNSRLASWFYFHETANLGTDRAKVVQADLLKLPFSAPKNMPDKDRAVVAAKKIIRLIDEAIKHKDNILRPSGEIFEKLDGLVYEYFGLDKHEIALIEESFEYIIPAMQPRRRAGMQAIWKNSSQQNRRTYAAELRSALRPWFRSSISASLVAKSSDTAILKLTLQRQGQKTLPYREDLAPNVDSFLRRISSNLSSQLPGNVQLVPDLRFIIGRDMYLVKPLQLRHWLRSTALADAEHIAAELSVISSGAEQQEKSSC